MRAFAALTACLVLASSLVAAQEAAPATTVSHALAEFGDPRYPADFTHFDYADPEAPKGGSVVIGTVGSFDTLNPVPLAGDYPRSIDLLSEQLMVASQDEIAVYYGLLAESIEYPDDDAWAVFTLRPEARWHDGEPITADDVVWTFDAIREKGRPFLQSMYEDVTAVEALDERRVRFDFATRGTRKPLARVAELSIMPRHWWEAEGRDIGQGTVEPPLGSGPYRIAAVDPGRSLTWERVPDHWARDLPVNRGLWNFDRIRYDYYRDRTVEFEAFKSGASDLRQEFTSLFWATGYDIPAVAEGRLIKAEIASEDPRGMQAFMMNTRRPLFADPKVREALGYLYDFEWVNKTLFFGLYERQRSYFNATGYRSAGVPEGLEREILEEFRGQIPDAVFDQPFTLPTTDGSGDMRDNIRTALRLLREAGYERRDGALVNGATGEPVAFEILTDQPVFERVILPFIDRLRQVGIAANLRIVDSAQWIERYQSFDFDMATFAYTFYPPPSTELRNYFGSAAAEVEGSGNIMGIHDPVVDALIEKVVAAPDLETKQAATRALDRVLLWSRYGIPQWGKGGVWFAYWDRFGFPPEHPPYEFGFGNEFAFQPTWWVDPEKDAVLAAQRG